MKTVISGLGGLRLELQFKHRPKGKPLARIVDSEGKELLLFDVAGVMNGSFSIIQPTTHFVKELQKRVKTEKNSSQKKQPKNAPSPVKTRRKLTRRTPK